ncbi:hypothetical protein SNE40_022479 [Patella caerulea]|uniref:Uncharacterized protein n=1 Tax=Patella caerulea TaxID=87958 RepID=A0AAN8J3X8_PATCE
MFGDCYKRGLQYSEFAVAEQSSVPVLEITPGVEALIKEIESSKLNVPQIKYTYFYSPETKADVGLSILKQYVGDLQMLSEKTFVIGFSVSQVTKDQIFWSKEGTTINFLSWHVGCMHTDKSTLGIYLKLKDGEYKTLKSLKASYVLSLMNNNNESLSVTIQDDCPRSFLPGNIGGWSFIDWKRLSNENGYLDHHNNFQVKATVRIERLDTV